MQGKERELQYQTESAYIHIDQLTVTFLHKYSVISDDEHKMLSEELIDALIEKMSFDELGEIQQSKNVNGYNTTYKTEGAGLTLSYHSEWPEMGVSVNFTASAFKEYKSMLIEQEGYLADDIGILKDMNQIAIKSDFKTRISRIDIAADYLNFGLSVNDLYSQILDKKVKITDHREKREKQIGQHIGDAGQVQTFYIGRYTTRTGFLRVYDKKTEQLKNTKSRDYEQALYCNDWVRVEAVFKAEQAHQITEILLAADEIEYRAELAGLLTSRYRFLKEDGSYHRITKELMMVESLRTYKLSQSSRFYNLERSMTALLSGQIQNTLYKVRKLKGEDYAKQWWQSLYEYNSTLYKPTKEVKIFINKVKKSVITEQ